MQDMFSQGAVLIFGATGGIGQHVVMEFAKAGADLALIWRSKEDVAKDVAARVEGLGRKVSLHHCDVTEDGAAARAVAEAAQAHGRVHTLVWGAGPLVDQVKIADVTTDQWKRAINTEVNGFFAAAQASVLHMRDNGGGSLVHLGSAGDNKFPDEDVLSVSPKAANESLIQGIAREEGRNQIRANSVLVGVIEAGMFLELTKKGHFDETWVQEVQKNLALKRWGQPEEIGHAAVFLASNRAAYVTGQQISVSGGYGI